MDIMLNGFGESLLPFKLAMVLNIVSCVISDGV